MPKDNRGRKWCLTLNNYTDQEFEELKEVATRFTIIGEEVGKTGTPHLQGFLYFQRKKSLRQMKNINPRAHWEMAKGTVQDSVDYCSKEDPDPFMKGQAPKKNQTAVERLKRNQVLLSSSVVELVDSGEISLLQLPLLKKAKAEYLVSSSAHQRDSVCGLWIYGPPGTGKTHYVHEHYGDNLFKKAQNKWWDGYAGEKHVLLDDLDTNVLGHYLKIWADKWSCTGEVKGSTIPLNHLKFIVTSNYTIGQLWEEDPHMREAIERRFEVITMMDRYIHE